MTNLILALAAFIGTHFLMSHPLRASMAKALGEKGFMGVYSLVSFATFAWIIMAFRAAPFSEPLWDGGNGLWWVATVLALLGMILLVGSFVGNPALPAPGAAEAASRPARGVFAITRHPMMWSFALLGLAHILVAPSLRGIILWGGMSFLALAGSAGQDRKKLITMGDAWRGWAERTSFVPFARGFAGTWPGRGVLLIGVLVWLGISYAHGWFGIPAGIWLWLWA
jgi:uncharacterized membrane protein